MKISSPTALIKNMLLSIVSCHEGYERAYLIDFAGKKFLCEFKNHRPKRSLSQNRLYFAWLKALSEHICGDNYELKDELHKRYKEKFLGKKVIKTKFGNVVRHKSTTELNTKEFNEYLDRVKDHAQSFFNYTLVYPDQVGYDEFIEQFG